MTVPWEQVGRETLISGKDREVRLEPQNRKRPRARPCRKTTRTEELPTSVQVRSARLPNAIHVGRKERFNRIRLTPAREQAARLGPK